MYVNYEHKQVKIVQYIFTINSSKIVTFYHNKRLL